MRFNQIYFIRCLVDKIPYLIWNEHKNDEKIWEKMNQKPLNWMIADFVQ